MCCLDEARKKIATEFNEYKQDVLRCNRPEIVWDLCNRIAFFCCVSEYFETMETIPEEFLQVVENRVHPIYAMWSEYLKNESLQYARWEDIEEILRTMAEKETEN